MNPGYLSFLILCIIMILLASGWKKQLIKGVPDPFIIVFLISWFICSALQLNMGYRVSLCYLLLLGVTIFIIFMLKSWVERVHLITVGLLAAALYVLFNQWLHLDPVYVLVHPGVNIFIGLSFIASIFIRQSSHQIAVITIGLMVGDLVHTWLLYNHLPIRFGTARLFDLWWLIFLGTRLISEVMEQVWKGFKQMLNYWLNH